LFFSPPQFRGCLALVHCSCARAHGFLAKSPISPLFFDVSFTVVCFLSPLLPNFWSAPGSLSPPPSFPQRVGTGLLTVMFLVSCRRGCLRLPVFSFPPLSSFHPFFDLAWPLKPQFLGPHFGAILSPPWPGFFLSFAIRGHPPACP